MLVVFIAANLRLQKHVSKSLPRSALRTEVSMEICTEDF